MNCKKIQKLLSPYVDSELDTKKVQSVETHLQECEICQEELDTLRGLSLSIKELPSIQAPPRFEDVVLTKAQHPSSKQRLAPVLGFLSPQHLKVVYSTCAAACIVVVLMFVLQGTPPDNLRSSSENVAHTSRHTNGTSESRATAGDERPSFIPNEHLASAPYYSLSGKSTRRKAKNHPFVVNQNLLYTPEDEEEYIDGDGFHEIILQVDNIDQLFKIIEGSRVACQPCVRQLDSMTFYNNFGENPRYYHRSPSWGNGSTLIPLNTPR